MKIIRFVAILMLAIGTSAVSVEAQRNRPKPKPTPRRTTPAKPPVTAAMITAKTQVSTQLYNVNLFVDKFGPIALSIENLDKEAKTRKVSKTTTDQNEASKQKVVQAIRILKNALVNLEADFRTKIDLRKYLTNIEGIGDLAAQAEDSAMAGRFVAAKEPLRTVAKKLSDTLAVLP